MSDAAKARIGILDHGYVELVETYGSDERIVEAARMSTGKGFLGWGPVTACSKCGVAPEATHVTREQMLCSGPHDFQTKAGDEKLLAFLWNNSHATPFEMGGLVIEVQAPIFVFREWHRHRTQSYNELSARYTPLPDVNYVPTIDRLMIGSDGKNKQAGTIAGAGVLTLEAAEAFQELIQDSYEEAEGLYRDALNKGVPKELARICIQVGRYSRMRASANLRNWLGFLTLRMAPNAQWEIRQYANAVGEMVAQAFPRTWALFAESRG